MPSVVVHVLAQLPMLLGLAVAEKPGFVSFAHADFEGERLRVVIAADGPLSANDVRTKLAARHLHVYVTGLRARADNRAWAAKEPGQQPVVAHRHAGHVEIKSALPSAASCAPPVTVREQDGRLVVELACTGGAPAVVAGAVTEAPAPIPVENQTTAPPPEAIALPRSPSGEAVATKGAQPFTAWWLLVPIALLAGGGALVVRHRTRARLQGWAEPAIEPMRVGRPEAGSAPAPGEAASPARTEPDATPEVVATPVASHPAELVTPSAPQPSAERSALERRLFQALFEPPGPGDLA